MVKKERVTELYQLLLPPTLSHYHFIVLLINYRLYSTNKNNLARVSDLELTSSVAVSRQTVRWCHFSELSEKCPSRSLVIVSGPEEEYELWIQRETVRECWGHSTDNCVLPRCNWDIGTTYKIKHQSNLPTSQGLESIFYYLWACTVHHTVTFNEI